MARSRVQLTWGRRVYYAVLGLTSLAILTQCRELLTFDVAVTSATTVEGSALAGLLGALDFTDLTAFDLTATEEFANQGVEPEDVESVRLSRLTLTMLSPEAGDLSFFKSLAFYVEAEGLDRQRIAHQESFESGDRSAEFLRDDVELAPYVVVESMSITVDVTADSPTEDTELEVEAVFTVEATRQAACKAVKDSL